MEVEGRRKEGRGEEGGKEGREEEGAPKPLVL